MTLKNGLRYDIIESVQKTVKRDFTYGKDRVFGPVPDGGCKSGDITVRGTALNGEPFSPRTENPEFSKNVKIR